MTRGHKPIGFIHFRSKYLIRICVIGRPPALSAAIRDSRAWSISFRSAQYKAKGNAPGAGPCMKIEKLKKERQKSV